MKILVERNDLVLLHRRRKAFYEIRKLHLADFRFPELVDDKATIKEPVIGHREIACEIGGGLTAIREGYELLCLRNFLNRIPHVDVKPVAIVFLRMDDDSFLVAWKLLE